MISLASYENYRQKKESITSNLSKKRKSFKKGLNKYERIMHGIAIWGSFYRANPHRLVKDYLGIHLKIFQCILFFMMHNVNYFMYLASRGQGKTFLVAIYCVVRAILYPESKIIIASKTMKQSREVIEKIEDLMGDSPNLKREINDLKTGLNDSYILFHNGSWIKTVAGTENSRGKRGNLLIVDEFRMVDLDVINKVLRKFLTAPRHPKYLDKPEYVDCEEERNKEMYMSSCWLKAHWAWDKVKAFYKSMVNGKDYFVCSLPYQLAIKEKLLSKSQVQDEKSESDFSSISWLMEMDALFYGESEKSYFRIKEMQDCRREIKAIYPSEVVSTLTKKQQEQIKKREDEIRIIGADIALMSSTKYDNDNTSIALLRLIPNGDEYIRQVLYLESCSGENTEDLAKKIKRLFYDFECDYCVLDALGNGIGVYDMLGSTIFDEEVDTEYPTWTCLNDADGNKGMRDRSKDPNALPLIYAIKATSEFNHKIATSLKTAFERGIIRFLVSESDAKDYLIKKKNYMKQTPEVQNKMLMPYIQTSLTINEIINLEAEVKNGYIKLTEPRNMRKDRYSVLAYTNYFASVLERDLIVFDQEEDINQYLLV